MSGASHPAAFTRLCNEAVTRLEELANAGPLDRGARIAAIRAALAGIAEQMAALDWEEPRFEREQAALLDAASALSAIDLDRGGPHVPRYAQRIADDLRRIATG
jgi:hypothetical protein